MRGPSFAALADAMCPVRLLGCGCARLILIERISGSDSGLRTERDHAAGAGSPVELETKVKRRFAKVSIVSYS